MKPCVNYDDDEYYFVKVGQSAVIKPMNHPNPHGYVSNKDHATTSVVIKTDGKTPPSFETQNTCYFPQER